MEVFNVIIGHEKLATPDTVVTFAYEATALAFAADFVREAGHYVKIPPDKYLVFYRSGYGGYVAVQQVESIQQYTLEGWRKLLERCLDPFRQLWFWLRIGE